MNIVLDTNVLMSGIYWKGLPRTILIHWYDQKFDLIISPEILSEYTEVAKNLNKKYTSVDSEPIIELVARNAHMVIPKAMPLPYCRDLNDRIFLQTAMYGKAKYIVSGDKDLLEVKNYPSGQVLSPREFVKLI